MSDRRGSWSRREFVSGLTVGGMAALLQPQAESVAAEPPPETTRIRQFLSPSICHAPAMLAEDLLRAEGFTEMTSVTLPWATGVDTSKRLAAGEVDLSLNFAAPLVVSLDAGNPIVVLAGVHVGCLELVASGRVRTIRDLKGKRVGVVSFGSTPHVFLAAMLAHVGLDPATDVHWLEQPLPKQVELLTEGKIDALIAAPPVAQDLRAKKVGRVVVATATDRPWSQYFCCMVEGNRDFVRRHPVATKRALRAMLKATSLCGAEPERAAQLLVDQRRATSYEYALQTMKELPYGAWRAYDAEDTLRFYALRLHEAKIIKSSPQRILSQGTDWRFLNELKKELKG